MLTKVSGWPEVAIASNGIVMIAGRPAAMCSESERWRAQACMQLTLAAVAGEPVVILDRADLLDGTAREGLIAAVGRVVAKTQMAVLVCTTMQKDEAYASIPGTWQKVRVAEGVTTS